MNWFEYAIIKYRPDSKRGEVINIGLIVFRNSGVDIRLLKTSSKLRIVDGYSLSSDLFELKESLIRFCSYAQGAEDQAQLINNFGYGLFLSTLAAFSIEGTHQYETTVTRLFEQLVKPKSIREPIQKFSRFHTYLKKEFRKMELLAQQPEDIDNHKIVPNYSLNTGSGLSADFMLKNGRYHMSEAIDFNVMDINPKFKEMSMKVMTFLEGKRTLDESMGCYLIYSATSKKESEVTAHLNLASDYSDRIFNFASKDDKASYYQMLSDLMGQELMLN